MAQGRDNNFIAAMLQGREREEGAPRGEAPENRISFFWDLFRGRFSKFVLIDLMVLLFCIPLAVVLFFRYGAIAVKGSLLPFSGWLAGSIANPNLVGVPEQIVLSADTLYGAFLIVAAFVAAAGISGGFFVVRNMIRTNGEFSARDFFRGIRVNFAAVLQATVFFSVCAYLLRLGADYACVKMALGEGSYGLWMTVQIAAYVVMALVGILFFWMLAAGTEYRVGFFRMLAAGAAMACKHFVRTVFVLVVVAVPAALMYLSMYFLSASGDLLLRFLFVFIAAFVLLCGVSFMILLWSVFVGWAFGHSVPFVSAPVPAGKAQKAPKETKESKAAAKEEPKELIRSDLPSRPVKPITDDLTVYDLPEHYSRADLDKLRDSKKTLADDAARYVAEHKNDEKYVVYNAKFERIESSADKKKGKKAKRKGDK